MSYLSKSKWMSCRSRTATNSEGTGRAAPEGLDAEDEPGAPAAGAGADRPAPDAAVVAGGIPQPGAITPRNRSGINPRGSPPRPPKPPSFLDIQCTGPKIAY